MSLQSDCCNCTARLRTRIRLEEQRQVAQAASAIATAVGFSDIVPKASRRFELHVPSLSELTWFSAQTLSAPLWDGWQELGGVGQVDLPHQPVGPAIVQRIPNSCDFLDIPPIQLTEVL